MTGVDSYPEKWRIVPSVPQYEASSLGRIRNATKRNIRRGQKNYKGYLYVGVKIAGKCKGLSVHRCVLEAFIGPCPANHEAAHLNGIRADNRLSNLRWVTAKENQAHRVEHGTAMKGANHPGARLTRSQLEEIIFRVGRNGETMKAVADSFSVHRATVSEIMSGKIYCSEWGMQP